VKVKEEKHFTPGRLWAWLSPSAGIFWELNQGGRGWVSRFGTGATAEAWRPLAANVYLRLKKEGKMKLGGGDRSNQRRGQKENLRSEVLEVAQHPGRWSTIRMTGGGVERGHR